MTAYDAVVYDLDGTLVHLDVDWAAVERDLVRVLADADVETDGRDTWALFDAAAATDRLADAEAVVAEHERGGARRSARLPAAAELPRAEPTGVCSLNCEAACRLALDRHDLAAHVASDAVVGRDTVGARKPDPTPLLAAVEALGATPAETLFVGDSPSDRETAERAGTDFLAVEPPWDDEPDGAFRDGDR